MKIIRYLNQDDQVGYGTLERDQRVIRLTGDLIDGFGMTDEVVDVKKTLAPLIPTNILCLGLNYRTHAEESGMAVPDFPVLFLKSTNATQNPEDPIALPTRLPSQQVDYEGELAIVIGKTAKNVSRENAFDYILGYTCANDVSARDWQLKKGGGQWCRGKVFDTFCPLGPAIVTIDEIPDPNKLRIQTRLNDTVVQDGKTSDMIFDIPYIIEFLSGSTTLSAGTVILTGTPKGVGMALNPPRYLKAGDQVEIEIEKIGTLRNPVEVE